MSWRAWLRQWLRLNRSRLIDKDTGGQGGIRTHGELAPSAVFKTAAFDHSATCPHGSKSRVERVLASPI